MGGVFATARRHHRIALMLKLFGKAVAQHRVGFCQKDASGIRHDSLYEVWDDAD